MNSIVVLRWFIGVKRNELKTHNFSLVRNVVQYMSLYSWLYSTCHNHKRHILKSLFALQMQQSFLKSLLAVSLARGFAYFAVAVGDSEGL